jgi:uncharacterized protein with HEPN domain
MKRDPRVYLAQIIERPDRIREYTAVMSGTSYIPPVKFFTIFLKLS